MIAKFAKKISELLVQKEIVQREDVDLYRYGIENGITVAGNILASVIFGIVTGRPGRVLVFLLFYASLRSYSGGIHCKSKAGCFFMSLAILFIPVYTCEPVMEHIPVPLVILTGVIAVMVILVLSPVESINKPFDEQERNYFGRISHCIVILQACVLAVLFGIGQTEYFYSGYISLILIAIFMVMGVISLKKYR